MISVDEALQLIAQNRLSRGHETISLWDGLGRTLTQAIVAARTHPPHPVSAMDGYAVRLSDVSSAGATLTVIGEAPAGAPFEGRVEQGQAVRIFTGGYVPEGANHIVLQEDADRSGDRVTCLENYSETRHIRAAGIDFKVGETLLESGTKLTAGALGLAAAANQNELVVEKKLRVGILANGNELKRPGSDLQPGEIINSNPFALAPLIERWGGVAVDLGVAKDSIDSILEHVEQSEDIDIFLPVGGASVGDHDYVKPAFAEAGFETIFSKVAVKPGKPTWFGKKGEQRVLGLPGNPASALVCAHLFLRPLLQSEGRHRWIKTRSSGSIKANGRREQFLRGVAELSPDATLSVAPWTNQDSSLLHPFSVCNALIRRSAEAPEIKQGDLVECLLIGSL